MAFQERLALLITGDASGAIREFQKVGNVAEKDLGKAHSNIDKIGSRLQIGGAAAVGFAAVAGRALFSFAKESEAAHAASIQLDNTLQNAPQLANANKKAFTDLATSLQLKTVADDDAVVSGEALLGQMGLTQKQILAITPLAVDLSRKMGVDLQTAFKVVGKSAEGVSSGALKKMGVVVDETKFKSDAFGATMAALGSTVGGFAETEGKTFSGRLEILKNQLGEVKEGIGTGVVDAVSSAIGPVTSLSQKFANMDDGTKHLIGGLGTIGVAATGAVGGLSVLAGTVAKLRTRFLANPEEGLSGGLNLFGKAAGVAGIAAIGLGVAYTVMQKQANDAQKRVDDLTDAVRTSGKTMGEVAGNELADWIGKHGNASDAAENFGLSVTDLNSAIQGSKSTYQDILGPLNDYVAAHKNQQRGLTTEIKGARDLKDAIDQQRSTFQEAKKNTLATNDATKQLAGTSLDGTTAAKQLGDATDDAADSIKDQADAAKTAEDNLKAWTDAVFGNRDAQRGLDDAMIGLNSDTREYIDKAKEAAAHGYKNAEANEAWQKAANAVKGDIDQVAQAAKKQAEQQAALYGKTLSAAEAARVQKDKLIELRNQIAPNSPFRGYLDTLIADLDRAAAPRQGTTNITVKVNGKTEFGGVNIGGNKIFRAKGGPVSAREPYIVGEEGPELFVPKTSGTIVPNSKVAGSGRLIGGRGGGDIYITANIHNPSGNGDEIAYQLVRALKSGTARNELSRLLN